MRWDINLKSECRITKCHCIHIGNSHKNIFWWPVIFHPQNQMRRIIYIFIFIYILFFKINILDAFIYLFNIYLSIYLSIYISIYLFMKMKHIYSLTFSLDGAHFPLEMLLLDIFYFQFELILIIVIQSFLLYKMIYCTVKIKCCNVISLENYINFSTTNTSMIYKYIFLLYFISVHVYFYFIQAMKIILCF